MVVGAPRSKCTDTLVPDTTLFRSNFKDDVDTILIQLHHLRINCCRETALTPVQLDNAGNVSPYLGPRKNLTRRQLDFRLNFFVLQPLVALQHRSEEHTSDLQSLMRILYAVFCLKTHILNPII